MSLAETQQQGVRFLIPNGEDRLYDVAQRAVAEQMHVIHNGSTIMVCSVIPAGWKKLAVKEKTRKLPDGEVHFCAYPGDLGRICALPPVTVPLKMGTL